MLNRNPHAKEVAEMVMVLLSVLGMAVETPDLVWLDAYELQGGSVTLPSLSLIHI